MLETKEFYAPESYTKIGNKLQRIRTTRYIKNIEKEIRYMEIEKQTIETRLKFLYDEREKALYYNLLH